MEIESIISKRYSNSQLMSGGYLAVNKIFLDVVRAKYKINKEILSIIA
ncbi:MAG: hypothetical protein ACOCQW_05540 [Halanaerobiaceae bacterium]